MAEFLLVLVAPPRGPGVVSSALNENTAATNEKVLLVVATAILLLSLGNPPNSAVVGVEALHLRSTGVLPSEFLETLSSSRVLFRDGTSTTTSSRFVLRHLSSALNLPLIQPCDDDSFATTTTASTTTATDHRNQRQTQSQILCFDNVASEDDLQAWREDALALQAAGFGSKVGTVGDKWGNGTRKTSILRKNVHQIWLQSPENDGSKRRSSSMSSAPLLLQHCYIGNPEARNRLVQCVEQLRRALDLPLERADDPQQSGPTCTLPPNRIELSYLLYDVAKDGGSAFYDKHLDCSTNPTSDSHWRRVSFLLYLGGTDPEVPWDLERDGGALRVHGSEYLSRAILMSSLAAVQEGTATLAGQAFADLAPIPGRLVLFDSATVEHEVRPTRRKRLCVVGWFGTSPLNGAESGNGGDGQ